MAPILGLARDGWPILIVFALATAAAWGLGSLLPDWWVLVPGLLATIVTLWCLWFFRDPDRAPPPGDALVLSGADGVVCFVGPGAPPAELHVSDADAAGLTRVSVFMDLFSVHVNRAPVAGRVEHVSYKPGAFLNASFDKASELNERAGLTLRTAGARLVPVVQIAGLVARRIVCKAKPGMTLAAGQRFGMIRFGSRVDVYLPAGVAPLVKVGDQATAGRTILARLGGEGSSP